MVNTLFTLNAGHPIDSKADTLREPREGDDIADVTHPSDILHKPLKAKTKTSMRRTAISP